MHSLMHMSSDVDTLFVNMSVYTLYLLLCFKVFNALALLQTYIIISPCCLVHHVSLCHQSCASVLQMQVPEGRPPVIKKCLFPLFSPKNNIKHSSSVRVLPVVSSPMVHAVLHSPTHLLTPSHIACISSNDQDCFIDLFEACCQLFSLIILWLQLIH